MSEIKIQTKPKEGDLGKHPGQLFKELWNKKDIKKELERAKKSNEMPFFNLDKIELHPAKDCNLRCSFCYGKDVVPDRKYRRALTLNDIEKVLTDVRENMPNEEPLIIYAGLYSEPLLNQGMGRIVEITGEKGFRQGIYTNGLLMKESFIEKMVESAIRNKNVKPSYIVFNVTASIVSKNSGRDLATLLKNIQEISRVKKEKKSPLLINCSLHAVADKGEDYRKIALELRDIGVDNIRLSFPWEAQKNELNQMGVNLTREQYIKYASQFEQLGEEFPELVSVRYPPKKSFDKCFVSTQGISISSEGDVFPCPEVSSLLFKKTHSYGSVHEKKISEIWHGKEHRKLFSKLNPCNVEKSCVCCHTDEDLNKYFSQLWSEGDY